MAVGFPTKANWAAGDVLTASAMDDLAGTVNLLQYSAYPYMAGKNAIINGGMDIWQRGTSINISTALQYGADRWYSYCNAGTGTYSRQSSGLTGIQYCQRVQRNAGQTATGAYVINSSLESANCYLFAGQTVTMSFYARAGANFSAASNVLNYYLFSGTGTDQNIQTNFTGQVTVINNTATLTTSWQRFSFSAAVGTTATQLAAWFQFTPTGTAGANDYFEVTGVQVELGSVATTFARTGGTISLELAACQRYYYRNSPSTIYAVQGQGGANSTTSAVIFVQAPVPMRTTPSSTVDWGNLQLAEYNGTSKSITTITTSGNTVNAQIIALDVTGSSSLTVDRPMYLRNANSSSGYLGFTAEL
jgi:hypothetical protein